MAQNLDLKKVPRIFNVQKPYAPEKRDKVKNAYTTMYHESKWCSFSYCPVPNTYIFKKEKKQPIDFEKALRSGKYPNRQNFCLEFLEDTTGFLNLDEIRFFSRNIHVHEQNPVVLCELDIIVPSYTFWHYMNLKYPHIFNNVAIIDWSGVTDSKRVRRYGFCTFENVFPDKKTASKRALKTFISFKGDIKPSQNHFHIFPKDLVGCKTREEVISKIKSQLDIYQDRFDQNDPFDPTGKNYRSSYNEEMLTFIEGLDHDSHPPVEPPPLAEQLQLKLFSSHLEELDPTSQLRGPHDIDSTDVQVRKIKENLEASIIECDKIYQAQERLSMNLNYQKQALKEMKKNAQEIIASLNPKPALQNSSDFYFKIFSLCTLLIRKSAGVDDPILYLPPNLSDFRAVIQQELTSKMEFYITLSSFPLTESEENELENYTLGFSSLEIATKIEYEDQVISNHLNTNTTPLQTLHVNDFLKQIQPGSNLGPDYG